MNILTDQNRDRRPQKGAWAPGDYENTCHKCGNNFLGDKRAKQCAACVYNDEVMSDGNSD